MLKGKKVAVLGAGKLGEILIKGLLDAGVINIANVRITAGHQQRLDSMRERFNVAGTLSNKVASATTVRPTELKMNFASSRCSLDAFFPADIPVIPLLSRQGVLGIARMTGTGAPRCFSMKAVLTDAATEIRS